MRPLELALVLAYLLTLAVLVALLHPVRWTGYVAFIALLLAIAQAYALAFFDRHLKGRPAPLLDRPAAQYPEVRFETRLP